jgi:ATP-dependent DNA helicase PIF1
MLLGWQANIDFTPITSCKAVLAYIAKYCSKSEKKSESAMFNSILGSLNSQDTATVAYQKFLGKVIVERDWSAQESMHLLLHLLLYHSSQQVYSLNVSPWRSNEFEPLDPMMDDDTIAPTKLNMMDRYEQRSTDLDLVNLLKMFRYHYWDGQKKRWVSLKKHPKRRCLNVWPNYISDRSMYENWCRAKLQPHHPYRNLDDLRIVDGEHVDWSEAYEHCKADCGPHEEDPLPEEEDLKEEEDEDEFEEPEGTEEQRVIRCDWQVYTGRGPRAPPGYEERLGSAILTSILILSPQLMTFNLVKTILRPKREKAKLWTKIQM